ncbi:MAG: transporter [Candidatus Poribacteria bacterium]|nr:transporter [Candidatus Poribacteria bacterium]
MKSYYLLLTCCLSFHALLCTSADTPKSRPDSHAPIGVMGDHAHKQGEVMLSYRFMAMDMRGLQSGTTALETTGALKAFMMAPTQMGMQMHMFGAMFAPHDEITFMAMTSYQQRHMEMQGAHHHKTGHHTHPVGSHEMSSAGIGDTKFEGLLTVWKKPHLTLLGNIGISLPTGSIEQKGENGQLLPYPMQLGSGSFQAHPGATIFGYYGNWSYGSQLRGAFPLHTNASDYRHGNTITTTAWGERRINDWISIGSRLLFSHEGNIHGSHPDLNPKMSPSHRSDFRGGTRLDIALSSNLLVPTGNPLGGQRFAVEFIRPIYENLTGTQLKTTWRLLLGWQYAFHL